MSTKPGQLQESLERSKKGHMRSTFRIKRLEIKKPTAATEGYWLARVVFQAPREPDDSFRLNLYTQLRSGKLYGTYVVGRAVWDGASQEYSWVGRLDSAVIPKGDRVERWRAEIGWKGVCCHSKDTKRGGERRWWMEPVAGHHGSNSRYLAAPGRYRVVRWGQISESSAEARLRAE